MLIGCRIDALDMNETLIEAEKSVLERRLCQHVVVNVAKFVDMQKDTHLKEIVTSCDIVNADGMPLVWASRILGNPLPCRVTGVDLFFNLIELCARKKYKPFFFGARQWVVEKVVLTFKEKYPDLQVAGYRNGYYFEDEEREIADQIKDSGADMLFVGFSSPKKEYFLNTWMDYMQVPFCMGVGGSFDIVAGKSKRAPKWMQDYGLEWAYRIYQEPRRMWKRYAKTNPVFMWMVFKAWIKKNLKTILRA